MKHRTKYSSAVALMTSVCILFGAGAAQASTITVGSVLPPGFTSKPFEEVQTRLNTALPEKGANLVSPVSGAIVRWRVQGAKGGPFFLRVLHPNGTGAYTASGTSGAAIPTDTGLQTFTANLPIKAGDLIGIDPTNATDEIGVAEVPGASYASIFPRPFEGATVPTRDPKSGLEIELSAEVQPTPAITTIAPSFGSIAGGTVVKITGTDFTTAGTVKFGDIPAAGFAVISDTEMTATAPETTKVGPVDLTVTTIAGTSLTVNADRFDYQACVVPKLKDNKLKAAKTRLRNAGCKIGKVKKLDGAKPKNGLVTKQNPKPKKVLVPGTKVNVTLEK
ncbi:MAG TPA: IPT/TIG domain-containing protein [Solirubrobacterales bacterium]|nr:IPT/TIG domain-containing protein [Solirubrobacterales bacterium]